MTEEHAENAIRLLDIVYDLYGGGKGYPTKGLPFTVNQAGTVDLHEDLVNELRKEGNEDLLGWAQDNIKSLFEWVISGCIASKASVICTDLEQFDLEYVLIAVSKGM